MNNFKNILLEFISKLLIIKVPKPFKIKASFFILKQKILVNQLKIVESILSKVNYNLNYFIVYFIILLKKFYFKKLQKNIHFFLLTLLVKFNLRIFAVSFKINK